MARRREMVEGDGDEYYEAPPPSPWGDTKVVVTIVVAVGVLGIVGALVYRQHQHEALRRRRVADYKKLGSKLVREVHKLGVEFFSQGKATIDPSRWEALRQQPALVDAILIQLDDFEQHFVAAARYADPKIAEYPGSIRELGGGVKMSKGRIVSGGAEVRVWIFHLYIQDDKGRRLGKAMVCLKSIEEK